MIHYAKNQQFDQQTVSWHSLRTQRTAPPLACPCPHRQRLSWPATATTLPHCGLCLARVPASRTAAPGSHLLHARAVIQASSQLYLTEQATACIESRTLVVNDRRLLLYRKQIVVGLQVDATVTQQLRTIALNLEGVVLVANGL